MSYSYMEKLKRRLKELTSIIGQSGYEDLVIDYIKKEVDAEQFTVDTLGNVIIQLNKCKTKNSKKLMLFAHMDEVGFVTRKIEKNGFIRVERMGGVHEPSMAGQTVVVQTNMGPKIGVIGTKSHHYTKSEEKFDVVPPEEIYLDFGFKNKKEAIKSGIEVGTPISYKRQFFSNDSIVFSNSLDNRVGCLILLELIDKLQNQDSKFENEVYIVFSVQEEFNLRGILPAVRNVDPDIAIALDLIIASDTPDLEGYTDVRLGNGPCINKFSFHGRGTLGGLIPNPKLVDHIIDVAKNNGINLNKSVFMGGLTDASFSQLEMNGIPMVDLAFPARYSHAPIEAVDLNDVMELIDLLEYTIPTLNNELDLKRGSN